MAKFPIRDRAGAVDRRVFLRRLGQGAAAAAAMAPWLTAAAADDRTLQALIEQNQRNDFGQGFDSASRTIHMPHRPAWLASACLRPQRFMPTHGRKLAGLGLTLNRA